MVRGPFLSPSDRPSRDSIRLSEMQLSCDDAPVMLQQVVHRPKFSALQEKLYSCPAILYLRKSLEDEREIVCDFLFAMLDEILTPLQEAYLDTHSYPWWPDLYQLSNALAKQHKARSRFLFANPGRSMMAIILVKWMILHAYRQKHGLSPTLAKYIPYMP